MMPSLLNVLMPDKVCSKCGKVVPGEEFHRDSRCKDGYTKTCLECWHAYKRRAYDRIKHNNKNRSEISGRIFVAKAKPKKSDYICAIGQVVKCDIGLVSVTEILEDGYTGGKGMYSKKSFVAGNPIDKQTGKPLTRSFVSPGTNWECC